MRTLAVIVTALLVASCASPTQPTATPTTTPTPSQPTAAPTATPPATDPPTPSPTIVPPVQTPTAVPPTGAPPASSYTFEEFDVPVGSHPHDVAPGPDGTILYTAQHTGRLGILDPETGETADIRLGEGSAPHGVIVGPDGSAWITDGGLNAIHRVFPHSLDLNSDDRSIWTYPLPRPPDANLNTAAFDGDGVLWFTAQSGGVIGSVDPATGEVEVFDAPRGPGPYGICATPDGEIWFVSLAGSYLGRVDRATGEVEVLEPPTAGQGARRVWSDSAGRLWISEWNAGQLGMYDPALDVWREWLLPGDDPMAYSVYVDELDLVWLTDFDANSIVRFDPATETFDSFTIPTANAAIRQQLGREGELWGAESATDKLVVLRRT